MRWLLALTLILSACQKAPEVRASVEPSGSPGVLLSNAPCVQPVTYDMTIGEDATGEFVEMAVQLKNCGPKPWRGLQFVSVVLAQPDQIVLTEPFRLTLGEAGPETITNLSYRHRYNFEAGHYSVWMMVLSGQGSSAHSEFELNYNFELVPKN